MVQFLTTAALFMGLASASPVNTHHTSQHVEKRDSTYWYANMDHTGDYRGYAPDLDGDYDYPVFKAVSAGASADDIQSAINSGSSGDRHQKWLASQPRVVYIPPGTYNIDKTINMNTDTILMGDATDPPVLKASSDFDGDTLLNGKDPGVGDSGELSFAVGLKNLVLDTTAQPGGNTFTGLYWGVAQGAQLQNINITMPSSYGGQGHSGIRLGRGSTLGLSDVRVEYGQNGILHDGHQQAEYKSIYFYKNTVGMLITGGNTIQIIAPTFDNVGTAVSNTGGSPYIGLVDATSINSGVTFHTSVYPSFLIDNLTKDTDSDVAQNSDGTLLGAQSHVDTYTYGNTVGGNPIYGATTSNTARPSAVAPGGRFPAVPAPNYASNSVSDFVNVKDPSQNGGHTVKGDNTVDEADALNAVLQYAVDNKKIAYFPFGKYRVDSTLLVPAGSQIVGEAWATITGNGDFFKDSKNPKPVVSVGKSGDTGIAHIQDMRFTVSDVLPGAIIVQFNIAGSSPGDVALWNSLVTVGGTRGASALTDACTDASNECQGAFLGIHFTSASSAYVENVWNWVADHITEDFDGGNNIAGKGGVLVESTKGTWLHALGSEHWWLYQLNLNKAENVMVSLLQSETNYDQGDVTQQAAPAPWSPDVSGYGDPDFSWCPDSDTRCRMGFASFYQGGSDVYVFGAASWVFYKGPGTLCTGQFECQDYLHWVAETPDNFQAFGLCSKDAYATLHLANGTNIITSPDFKGSWDTVGGDIGRYTP